MTKYQDLQKQASALGMEKVVGASTDELIAFIDRAGVTPEVGNEPAAQVEEVPKHDLAIVFDGAREVRRFDLHTHKENFIKLAEGFASKFKYRVEMGFLAGKIECPNCGHTFN